MIVLDGSGAEWMAKWNRLFNTFQISHLRSPMFFHPDPGSRDALLAYAYETGRADELQEIAGVVGKEISKHRRKKEKKASGLVKSSAKPAVTIDERDRKDYYVPSSSMFKHFCRSCVDHYGLEAEQIMKQEMVQDIDFGTPDEALCLEDSCDMFTVRTNRSTYFAKTVVLAVGAGAPSTPHPFPSTISKGARHAVDIQHRNDVGLVDPSVVAKMKLNRRTNVLVIGGGLTSAQVADALVRGGVSKVWLFMRGPCKGMSRRAFLLGASISTDPITTVKPFDVDLSWIAKFKNHQQASFWSADTDEGTIYFPSATIKHNADSAVERLEYVKEARNGGSITPRFMKKLKQHVISGKLAIHTHTTVATQNYDADLASWTLATTPPIPDLPPFDYIYFATGAQTDVHKLDFLQTMHSKHPIASCGGLPVLTDDLMWSANVPLFVTGRLATLRIGPGAGNLEGARAGAERIAWAIEDVLDEEARAHGKVGVFRDGGDAKMRYAAGVGSRFESLGEDDGEE
nr:hypothetical protein CFP56_41411 [Quercus suber]